MASEIAKEPKSSNETLELLKKLYLVLYNSLLAVAWALVLMKASIHYSEKTGAVSELYGDVEYWLKIAQTAAVLEVIHALFGLVKSSVVVTMPQVASRIVILWVILDSIVMKNASTRSSIGFPMLLVAWTITEIIRYTYYTNVLLDNVPFSLQWCRYTFFIVLYPLGVAGEIICVLAAIPIAQRDGLFSFPLPNKLNVSFDFVYACYFVVCVLYGPVFYHLYTHMLNQRKKILCKKEKNA